MATRTGGFGIGIRRTGGAWQRDLPAFARWAKEVGFGGLDLGRITKEEAGILAQEGLRIGTVDLDTSGLMDNDSVKRQEAIARAVSYVQEATALGAKYFFLVVMTDPAMNRAESHARAVESYAPIVAALDANGASLAIEGWPGGSPHLPALCCTPESCRRFIADLGGKGVGLNYDPSHLIRMGIDHIRFLKEFLPYIRHAHGKDTELYSEALYEYGLYQPSIFTKAHGWGEQVWRYTIPGHGSARWTEIFAILANNGYTGMVSVELEDENFNGTEAGERAGLLHSLSFLNGV